MLHRVYLKYGYILVYDCVTVVLFNLFTVPSKVLKRKSLSASGQKRRSLLPTPMGSKITRSQSQRSRPRSVNCEAKGALPFNISPSGEIKPKTAGASKSQGDVTREQSCSRSRFSDPFSPACQTVTVDSTENYGTGDSVVRNLIELSPRAKEVSQKLSAEIILIINCKFPIQVSSV